MDIDALPLGANIDSVLAEDEEWLVPDVRREYMEKHMDMLTSIVFFALCRATNSLRTHVTLAKKLGIPLVRLNFARPFQRYRMLSIAACRGGGATYKTAIGSTLVNTSMQGVQGYIQIIASFRMAVLPIEPAFTRLLPHVLCNGFLGGCNTQYVRNADEFKMASPHKPSVLVMPVPIDETLYHFPVHAFNKEIYPRDDLTIRVPLFKHSGDWALRALLGNDFDDYMHSVESAWENWDYTNNALLMSLAWHRSHTWTFDTMRNTYVANTGTGPRAMTERNVPGAAITWAGHGSKFDKAYKDVTFSATY